MILNSKHKDIKELAVIKGMNLRQVADKCGKSKQGLNKILNGEGFNGEFVKVVESLGYDIEIVYVEK